MPANKTTDESDGVDGVDGGGEAGGVVERIVNDGAGLEPEASIPGPIKESPLKEGQHQGVAVEERAPLETSGEAVAGERGRAKLQRARAVARGAMEEKVAPRVEKLRQTSSGVLDEAADDPSLRFVLIAVVIFILSLVLFFISKLLG
ncbi:MAG: hypothetical protein QOD00_1209 [Blastocatellia bacterium]|jgi:hypothetical protein|nr:hypothetical protein [Blastocatellia bacterium]